MYMGVASLAKMAMAFLPKTIWLCDVKMAYYIQRTIITADQPLYKHLNHPILEDRKASTRKLFPILYRCLNECTVVTYRYPVPLVVSTRITCYSVFYFTMCCFP